MKKLFMAVVSLAAFGLVACGGESTGGGTAYDATVKSAGEGKVVSIAGQSTTAKGTKVDWAGGNADAYMEASSVAKVADVSKTVADKLAKHNVEWLYTYAGLQVGVGDAGWNMKVLKNGAVEEVDGSFAVKVILGGLNDDQVFEIEQWIPDPKTAHTENLTEDTFFIPSWQEAADENGFSWADNSGALAAGVYTVVAAKYKEASAADVYGFGLGLVKTGELPQ